MSTTTRPGRARIAILLVTALVAALPALGLAGLPRADAAVPTLSYVGAASSAGNRTSHSVTLPATVAAGDTMVLFLTTNAITGTLGSPAGWSLLQSKEGTASRGRVWTRKATATDKGTAVTVPSSIYIKSSMSVAVYRSSAGTSAVTASAGTALNASATSHTTPAVAVAQNGSRLLSYWSEKSSTTIAWTAPSGSAVRANAAATGTGKTSSLLVDSNAAVPTGTAAGRVARTNAATSQRQLFSVVVSPGLETANAAPVPSFTVSCAGMACAFDASASTDPDGNALTYAWNFGDSTTGTGVRPTHTYAAGGARTVTLTVNDGTTTAATTRSVTPTSNEPVPGHSALVPETPRTDMPKITDGEILDIEVVGNRVFLAGTFTKIANNRSGNTTSYNQAGLAAYDQNTGLVDTSFRPTFTGGSVEAVEASPDGTKLFVGGNFKTTGGLARAGLARLDLTTGAPVAAFTANTDTLVLEVAVSNTTVYLGGRFAKVNGVSRSALAAVDSTTGVVDPGFVNDVTRGIGVNGGLAVQRLLLTHDYSKLLVVHTGRQVAGQDRYGIALISTATKALLPWRTQLWDDNLQFVGGVTRIVAAAVAPDDSYFVVSSGSGGDRPPISDTVVAYSFDGGAAPADVQPRWVSRAFDSVYSLAISEKAVYIGGHFAWNESPSAPDPWPGADDVGYGTGQGLSGYGLGDAVVNREHLGALKPSDGKALEWNPGSNSFEGNKAMEITPRGLITGGDATTQGQYNVGRLAFFDFSNVPAGNGVDTAVTEPISGRVLPSGKSFLVKGTATAPSGVSRVQVEVQNRASRAYLQDDLSTWSATWNSIDTTVASPGATTTEWSVPMTVAGNVKLQVLAKAFDKAGLGDPTKDTKKFETFGLDDAPPAVSNLLPASGVVQTRTFNVTGSATDDKGVAHLTMTLRDEDGRYLQDDGTSSTTFNAFRITPDVVGATSTTWSHEVTVPTEGSWLAQTRAVDTAGTSSLDTSDRNWSIFANGQAPTVSISAPGSAIPPTTPQPVTITPGKPLTFTGSATDDKLISSIDIALVNNSTHETLTTDGTFGVDTGLNLHRIARNVNAKNYNWSYTTPFDLTPGSYQFAVLATDADGITTPQAGWAILNMNAQVPGDAAPKATLSKTGLQPPQLSGLGLSLDGTATDDKGVAKVEVTLKDADTSRYLKADGTTSTKFATVPATLASPGALSTAWSLPLTLPSKGDWSVTAVAVDTVGQQDLANTGATARYLVYPGDSAPAFTPELLQPAENAPFSDGRIFVSGRAEDNVSMAKVEISVMDANNRYLGSNGGFASTTESWRTAFLTSPGTPGSNFSYTTPVLPAGAYTVKIRATDGNGLVNDPAVRHVTVSIPPGNNAPTAVLQKSCTANVCTFDARQSTDENAPTLTYAWTFGTGQGSGTGPLPKKTYTSAGTYTVTLVAKDEWGVSSPAASTTVTIAEPAGNTAPTPVINEPSCSGLTCNFSAVGTVDPNTGDSIAYSWSFGDPDSTQNTASGSASAHVFTSAGTRTVTLTATDGWGKASTVTRSVTVTAPTP